MSASRRVLIAGESWVTHSLHQKGFDSFTTTSYHEGVGPLRAALTASGFSVDYLPNHLAAADFPGTAQALEPYGAVILSDIGSNTLLLHPDTFERSTPMPDRTLAIRDYVAAGGGLVMVGGYLTFQGIEGRARWAGTPVEEALPVLIEPTDDRVEVPASSRRCCCPGTLSLPGCRGRGRPCSATTVCDHAPARTSWPLSGMIRSSWPGSTAVAAAWRSPRTAGRTGAHHRSWSGLATRRCGSSS
jgi:hypothetical protein